MVSEEESEEDTFLEEAFAALKDDDIEGFKAAMRGAIDACVMAADSEDDGEED